MTRCVLWLALSCKRYLRRPAFLLLLLVLPAGAGFFRREEVKEQPGIRIAVYAEQDGQDDMPEQLAKKLAGYKSSSRSLFSFYETGDEEELKRDVALGKAECGYVIHGGLREKLGQKKIKGAISLYEAPSTTAGLLSTETVFSLMIEEYDKQLFLGYMEDGILAGNGEALASAEELYDAFLENGSTFSFVYEEIRVGGGSGGAFSRPEGEGREPFAASTVFPVRGFAAVFVFITGLYGAVILGQDERKGLFLMLPGMEKRLCKFASLTAPVLLAAVSGLGSLWVSGELGSGFLEVFRFLVYVLAVAAFSMVLKWVTVSSEALCSLIPFFLIGSLVFCPVFLDVGRYVKAAEAAGKLFLPYYYLAWF